MGDQFDLFQTMTTTPRTFPQMISLYDVKGSPIDVIKLSSQYHLILITLKSTTCPVCPQLLKILNAYGLDPECNHYTDPFTEQVRKVDLTVKRFYRLLLKQDAYYIILCPGTDEEVREIQERTPFLDYPFISFEGNGKRLAKTLKIQLSEHELMPAILEVDSKALSVNSIYIGRGPGLYFHRYLLKRLADSRYHQETNGICALRDAHEIINLLKRRAIKCQEGRLVPPCWISNIKHADSHESKLSTTLTTIVKEPYAEEQSLLKESSSSSSSKIYDLPPEILEMIFFFFNDDVCSLVKASGTSRTFYVAVCISMTLRLRIHAAHLKPSLPQINGQVIWDETEVSNNRLDRWTEDPEGIPYRELCRRVSTLRSLLFNITEWTGYWSPRRFLRSK
ncbi:MAG: hypothetical protein EXX96DRAFT_539891 [Benjaminiella poitrasii]|nr:MAG: hypothetical protein EXX96DRAFT_539891 [Benjaminiella poitrasii]